MIYEVVLSQLYFGQLVINRWNYLSSGDSGSTIGSFGLLNAMGFVPDSGEFPTDTVAGLIQDNQTPEAIFTNVLVKALYDDPTDFWDQAFPSGVTGQQVTGQGMSPLNAFGFRTNRVRTDVARGTKRFVGISEAVVAAGGVIDSGTLAGYDVLAERMSDVLEYTGSGASLSFAPVICGKLEYEAPSGKRAYKYYPSLITQLAKTAQGVQWSPYTTVRSQTSRQYGNGA
jgi:hypothetical protein